MKKTVALIMYLFPFFLNAQQSVLNETQFEKDLSWQQVVLKAKLENKYIFVDCYATWCKPCKEMDKSVYTDKVVSDVLNSSFISVKLQLDTTKNDEQRIKHWYSVADSLKIKYRVSALPTYLFFSPQGKIVHRESGFKAPEQFIKVLADAVDPKTQVYTQLEKYKLKKMDFQSMPALAKNVYSILQDKELAFSIASYYKNNYLHKQSIEQLFKKENIEFITWYPKVLKSNDKYFRLIRDNEVKVDSVMNQHGFAAKIVNNVILIEEVYSKIYKNGMWAKETPKWNEMLTDIRKKIGDKRAERALLDARITWYTYAKDWDNVIKYSIIKTEKNGIDTSFMGRMMLNNFCYEKVFKYSKETSILNKAISWMEQILKFDTNDAEGMDTYAGLLYKVGRIEESIVWQEKAVKLDPDSEAKRENLYKMKRNEPTW